ncbi:VOC family protein [Streptomyces sp. ML-6]|uniref:VOC family protein n=1 Tax=unclassified Streptomyces TaxID=2593676 RepID=UPI0024BF136D|nr:VOC family protein [Streptomyces sp. ML-6]MDK0519232.1 VOC family protein [Streptomyces sp. ML-6]
MTATTVRGIDHIGVTVPDVETATLFLVRALGAEVLYDTLRRHDGPKGGPEVERRLGVPAGTLQLAVRMLALPCDGPCIELFEFQGPRREPPVLPCDFGWQHLALYADDLDAAVRDCVAAGAVLLAEPQPLPGPEAGERNRFAYLRTPWGSTLELLTYPDPQPWERTATRRRVRPAPVSTRTGTGTGTWPTDPARPDPD